MNEVMRLAVREERHSRSVVRTVSFDSNAGPSTLFFEISGEALPPPLAVHDFAVLAVLILAMREGRPIHVEGPVTGELLRRLEEFQEAWAMWRRSLRPVPITADRIVAGETPPARRGVFAFSGGVDATFALLRHCKARAGLRTAQPACAMLVHGFDIPPDERQAFERARRGVSESLRLLGVPLAIVRTNWRSEATRFWPQEYLPGLAACLHQFRGLAEVGVLGAGEDYGHLEQPWGSNNPITNHLLSGGGFEIHTEGGGFTRTERVGLICEYPEIARRLRVCWEGWSTGGNCGRCEKCVRTKLNFMAHRSEELCFDGPATPGQILRLAARNPQQLAFLREILASARANGARGSWMSCLALAIARNRLMLPARGLRRRTAGKLRSMGRRPRDERAALRAERKQAG